MKKIMLTITALVMSSTMTYADMSAPAAKSREAIKEEIKAHLEQVKTACASDVATAGCSSESREMMKCLIEHKNKNKDFKFSEGCQSALKSGRELRKERRMARKELQKNKKVEDNK